MERTMEQAVNFYENVKNDPAFFQELSRFGVNDRAKVVDFVAVQARSRGFTLTDAEIDAALCDIRSVVDARRVDDELSDAELEYVSGGGNSGCSTGSNCDPTVEFCGQGK